MRMFWTAFFLGAMLLIGLDVIDRRQSTQLAPTQFEIEGDPVPMPTPRP